MANCSGTYSGGKTKWYSCHQVWTQCRFFQSRTAPNCHGVSKRSRCMIDFSRPIRPHTSTSRHHVGFTCRHSPSYPHEIILKAYFASDAMLLCVLKKEHPCSVLDKFSRSCHQLPQFQPWSIMFHTCFTVRICQLMIFVIEWNSCNYSWHILYMYYLDGFNWKAC